MRRNPLTLCILATLLGACQQSAVHDSASVAFVGAAVNGPANATSREQSAARAAAKSVAQSGNEGQLQQRQEPAMLAITPIAAPPSPSPMMVSTMAAPQAYALIAPAGELVADTEHYDGHADHPVQRASDQPVSTFSIDVDTGSYSNVRRMLLAGQRPNRDAVRAEEMINYFDYGYAAPNGRARPFSVNTESARTPWNARHLLVQVGIQGYRVPASQIPASNLVFLIDTSGSMQDADKLPLLKRGLAELVERLRPQDRVSIVVYAGSAGAVLPPTAGDHKRDILDALERLEAGGSTNGGAGLELAYAMARQSFIAHGVNRVLLATDGDFNVGTVDQHALETMVADQRKSGVALTTLGFGTGNYDDAMAERLADVGDGNHAYIDSIAEARKVLVEEAGSTLLTIAADVKIQVEFNPAVVFEYRLIGYENRALRREDFDNDRVDAGEIGAGHDVTALYELSLVGSGGDSMAPLRYGQPMPAGTVAGRTRISEGSGCEIGWLRLRYKLPGAGNSQLVQQPIACASTSHAASPALRWSAAVAAYADLLRGGAHVGSFGWDGVHALAAGAVGKDPWGRRAEFLSLVDRAKVLTGGARPVAVSE